MTPPPDSLQPKLDRLFATMEFLKRTQSGERLNKKMESIKQYIRKWQLKRAKIKADLCEIAYREAKQKSAFAVGESWELLAAEKLHGSFLKLRQARMRVEKLMEQ